MNKTDQVSSSWFSFDAWAVTLGLKDKEEQEQQVQSQQVDPSNQKHPYGIALRNEMVVFAEGKHLIDLDSEDKGIYEEEFSQLLKQNILLGFQLSWGHLGVMGLFRCFRVCKAWDRLSKSNEAPFWAIAYHRAFLPYIEGEGCNRKEDFKILYKMSLCGRDGPMRPAIGKVPALTADCFKAFFKKDPFDQTKLIKDNYEIVILCPTANILASSRIPLLSDGKDGLEYFSWGKDEYMEIPKVPLSLKNIEMLTRGSDKNLIKKAAFNASTLSPDFEPLSNKITVWLIRRDIVRKDIYGDGSEFTFRRQQSYADQKKRVEGKEFIGVSKDKKKFEEKQFLEKEVFVEEQRKAKEIFVQKQLQNQDSTINISKISDQQSEEHFNKIQARDELVFQEKQRVEKEEFLRKMHFRAPPFVLRMLQDCYHIVQSGVCADKENMYAGCCDFIPVMVDNKVGQVDAFNQPVKVPSLKPVEIVMGNYKPSEGMGKGLKDQLDTNILDDNKKCGIAPCVLLAEQQLTAEGMFTLGVTSDFKF
jgi:hypothetical protein